MADDEDDKNRLNPIPKGGKKVFSKPVKIGFLDVEEGKFKKKFRNKFCLLTGSLSLSFSLSLLSLFLSSLLFETYFFKFVIFFPLILLSFLLLKMRENLNGFEDKRIKLSVKLKVSFSFLFSFLDPIFFY